MCLVFLGCVGDSVSVCVRVCVNVLFVYGVLLFECY